MSKVTVSVIIPAFQCANFITQALDSVFAQTYSNYEVIVVNDGSPDTKELESTLSNCGGRIVYLKQENGGPGKARNLGIHNARGEYIAFLDSDDRFLPLYLETQLKFLAANSTLDLVYADLLLEGTPAYSGKSFMEACPSKGEATFDAILTGRCQIPTSAVVARKEALLAGGLFDENLYRSEDFDLWLRMTYVGKRVGYQRKILGIHRIHSESLTSNRLNMRFAGINVLEKIDRTLDLDKKSRDVLNARLDRERALVDLEMGKHILGSGNPWGAFSLLKKSNEVLANRKVRLLLLGLRFTPALVVSLVRMRNRFLSAE